MPLPIDLSPSTRLDADAVRSGKLTNVPSDHMAIAEFSHGDWRKARIQAYRPIPMPPFALGLHYAQIVFEGMKAYRRNDGSIGVFRTERHHERFNRSLRRMCMPEVPYQLFADAIHGLVSVDHGWVPDGPDSALYLRPFMIASEERMGLKVADEYLFMVIAGPFRPLFSRPLRIKVEREFVRAAPGGTGYAKCAGNYAAAMHPTKMAQEEGYDQILWTDALTHSHVEESGATNVMFVIDGTLVTPPLTDTILDGVTRASALDLAVAMGIPTLERVVSVEELREGILDGTITEAFGVGTAASVAPIGAIGIDGIDVDLHPVADGVAVRLKKAFADVRFGTNDPFGWMHAVQPYPSATLV
jgi:branched-chain amino acid aminotransferase